MTVSVSSQLLQARRRLLCSSWLACFLLLLLLLHVSVVSSSSSIEFVQDNKVVLQHDDDDDVNLLEVVGELEEETGFYQSIAVLQHKIHEEESEYQHIEVYDSPWYYGKILVLDGVLQLTERDGASYNEMMAHTAIMAHAPNHPTRVLVIGGGDGYVTSELLKHASVLHVDHVELDGRVMEVCKKHFPAWGSSSDSSSTSRVQVHITDGASFVENAPDSTYDVIVQDSSDPWTLDQDNHVVKLPSSVLYEPKHFQNIYRILKPDGVFNMQAETFHLPSDLTSMISWRKNLLEVGFESARYGSVYTSSYSTGQIGFLLCQKSTMYTESPDYLQSVQSRFAGIETTYYHPKLQVSSFSLPKWVEDAIYHQNESILPEDKEL